MTYVFQYHFDDIEVGSEEEAKKMEHLKLVSVMFFENDVERLFGG